MRFKSTSSKNPTIQDSHFHKTTLKNGVRVLSESHPHSRAVSIGLWILTGTRHEPKGHEGVSHFLEHLVFKGTKSRSAFEIAKSLECLGGELNAYTTREYTCYHAYALKEHWNVALDVLTDLVSNMAVKTSDFELERSVILQEQSMAEDNIEELIFDLYFEKFLKDHPLGTPILGMKNSISSMTQKKVQAYYRDRYQGPNIMVSATGPIDHGALVAEVDRLLKKKERKVGRVPSKAKLKPSHHQGTHVEDKPVEQLHILLGLPSASFNDRTRFEAFVVNALLGGGMTSKLFQSIREKQGLAYSVFSSLNTFTDFGILNIYAATEKDKAHQVMKTIRKELHRLKSHGIRKRELDFFKTQVRGSLLLGSEDIENRMSSIAVNEMVFGRYRPVDEVIEEVEAISVVGVEEFMDKFFHLNRMGKMMIGGGAQELSAWFHDFDMSETKEK